MDAKAHQMCTVHLLRDLIYINELYKDKCIWTAAFKKLLQDAIQLKKEITTKDYYYLNIKRDALFEQLNQWLLYPIDERYKLSKKLQKKTLGKAGVYRLFFTPIRCNS